MNTPNSSFLYIINQLKLIYPRPPSGYAVARLSSSSFFADAKRRFKYFMNTYFSDIEKFTELNQKWTTWRLGARNRWVTQLFVLAIRGKDSNTSRAPRAPSLYFVGSPWPFAAIPPHCLAFFQSLMGEGCNNIICLRVSRSKMFFLK